MSIEEIALGYVHVANESMSRPIRALTEVIRLRDLLPIDKLYRFREKVSIFAIMYWHALAVLVVNMLVLYVAIIVLFEYQ